MALERQTVSVPFAGGVDTKTDPKQVQMGKLLSLVNGVYSTPGTIRKRRGSTLTGTVSDSVALMALKNDIYCGAETGAIYGVASDGTTLNNGYATPCTLTQTSVGHTINNCTGGDSAAVNGFRLYTWYDSGNALYTACLNYSVIEESTGTVVLSGTASTASDWGQCVALGEKLVLVYSKSTSIHYRMVDTSTTLAMSGEATLVASIKTSSINDICVSGEKVYCAYQADNSNMGLVSMDSSGTIDTPATWAALISGCVNVFPDSTGNLVVAWNQGTDLKFKGYTDALVEAQSIVTVTGGTAATNITGLATSGAGSFNLFATYTSTTVTKYSVVSSWSAAALAELKRGVGLTAKAFNGPTGDGVYLVLSSSSTLQSTHFLYNATTGKWVGAWDRGIAYGAPPAKLAAVNTDGDSVFFTSPTRAGVSTQYSYGVDCIDLDFSDTARRYANAVLAESLHIQGAQLWLHDGKQIVEHGFYLWPEGVTVATSSGTTYVYGYQVCYEWQDNQGRIHRSAPCPTVQYTNSSQIGTGGSPLTVTVTIPRLWVTNKANVEAVVYRTEANGSIYKRVGSVPCGASATYDTVAFSDANTDATIASRPQIYTTGGVLENGFLGPNLCPTVWGNRIWAIDASDRNTLRYSKSVVAENGGQGSPVEFVDAFLLDVPEVGGDCTAIGVLDEKLIVFKRDRVFVVTGKGPDDLGGNDDLSIFNIQTSIGTIYPKSVVSGPEGLFFQGPMGITKLDRSLQSTFVGYDVSGELGSRSIVNAVVVQSQNQIRFATSSTFSLVYDYLLNLWSKFSYDGNTFGEIVVGSSVYRLDSLDNVYKESSSLYTDNGSFVQMSFRTSWLQLGKILGFQRVRRMMLEGEGLAAEHFNISVFLDFNDATSVQDFTSLDVSVGDYRHRFDLARQKCSSIQIYGYDSQADSANGALALSALMFEAGVKRGTDKIPATQHD